MHQVFFVVVCATKTYLLSFLHVISISFIQLGFHFSTFLSNRPLQNSLDVAHKFDNLQWWKILFFSLSQTNQKTLNIHILTFMFPLFCSYSPCQNLNQISIWDHNSEMRWGGKEQEINCWWGCFRFCFSVGDGNFGNIY